jgi:hypothetical protein
VLASASGDREHFRAPEPVVCDSLQRLRFNISRNHSWLLTPKLVAVLWELVTIRGGLQLDAPSAVHNLKRAARLLA